MANNTHTAESACDNILSFPRLRPTLRPDVPAFDPDNPTHLRAWEAVFDMGKREADRG